MSYIVPFKRGNEYLLLKISDTKNDLTVEVGGYENVMVLRDIKVVDGDFVEVLKQLPRGSVHGDCIQFGH